MHESNLFLSIGKQLKDEYGCAIGRITSFAVNPNGTVDFAYVDHGNGKLEKYPAEDIRADDTDVILLSRTKTRAATFCDQIPLVWRKEQALRSLVDKNKISPEVYEDLHKSFADVLDQLKDEAQTLMGDIDQETSTCTSEIKDLNFALVNLEIEHEIGKIDDESYETSFAAIQECIKNTNSRKDDLENLKAELSNILLGEATPQADEEPLPMPHGEVEAQEEHIEEPVEQPPVEEQVPVPAEPASNLPEPPVVVYVKEVGESST